MSHGLENTDRSRLLREQDFPQLGIFAGEYPESRAVKANKIVFEMADLGFRIAHLHHGSSEANLQRIILGSVAVVGINAVEYRNISNYVSPTDLKFLELGVELGKPTMLTHELPVAPRKTVNRLAKLDITTLGGDLKKLQTLLAKDPEVTE